MPDEFARKWTYRDPLLTVTYPKGWTGALPAEQRAAARKDAALVISTTEPAPRKTTAK